MRILVSGSTRSVARLARQYPDHLGHLVQPHSGNRLDRMTLPWAADNAAYSHWDAGAFCRLLGQLASRAGLLWVAAPDVVGDARATLARFAAWLPVLRELGLPVALVAQDGQEQLEVPWEDIAALFIGGSTEWKLSRSACDLVQEAKATGKQVHMGRVNSLERLRIAHSWGCDSVDGTGYSRFADALLPEALAFIRGLDHQRVLFS